MDVTDFAINALGFAGTAFSFLMWVPQARITWQSRNDAVRLAGISETTQWLLVLGYSVWGMYGLLSASLWVAAPSIIAIPLAAATVVVIRRGRRLPDDGRSFPIFSSTDADPIATISDGLVALTESIPIISSGVSAHSQFTAHLQSVTVPVADLYDEISVDAHAWADGVGQAPTLGVAAAF
ncbi:MAG: hypothetical protein ACOH1K_03915 [Rhodoglobus sp.]